MKITDKKSHFCMVPWTHVFMSNFGSRHLCCKNFNTSLSTIDTPLVVHWNSDAMQEIRRGLINNERLSICEECLNIEDSGLGSMRNRMNRYILEDVPVLDASIDYTLANQFSPIVTAMPFHFVISIGPLCNLKCRMCYPANSTQIKKEATRYYPYELLYDDYSGSEWFDIDKNRNDILDILEANPFNSIDFVGGEPSLHPKIGVFLDECISRNIASKTHIEIIFNGTKIPDDLIDKILQFKIVTIAFSLDGTQISQEYIRFPSKWPVIYDNLIKVGTVGKQELHVTTKVMITIQIFNIMNLYETLLMFERLSVEQNLNYRIILNILRGPEIYRIEMLPIKYRKKIADDLQTILDNNLLDSPPFTNGIILLIDSLRNNTEYLFDDLKDEFWLKTEQLDTIRKQNLKQTMPELYDILKNH